MTAVQDKIENEEQLDDFLASDDWSNLLRKKIEFKNDGGDFSAVHLAEDFLSKMGCSCGASQRGAPRAVFFYECWVSKWRNLGNEEEKIHACLTSKDNRCLSVFYEPKQRGLQYLSLSDAGVVVD